MLAALFDTPKGEAAVGLAGLAYCRYDGRNGTSGKNIDTNLMRHKHSTNSTNQ